MTSVAICDTLFPPPPPDEERDGVDTPARRFTSRLTCPYSDWLIPNERRRLVCPCPCLPAITSEAIADTDLEPPPLLLLDEPPLDFGGVTFPPRPALLTSPMRL